MLNIVLHEPEMLANTGNIGRTCVAAGARLHLIEPLGFSINDKMVKTGGFPNDGLGGLTAGFTYYFKGRGFRVAPQQAVMDELAAANLVLANQVNELQNRPPQIKIVEKEVIKPVEKQTVDVIASIPSTIPFKFNSAIVQDVYDPLIYNIGNFLKNNPKAKIRIVGYADKFGPINVNLRISKERAEAVANMLKKEYGISADRMQIEYVGKEKPYYKNNNKWNRCAMVELLN